MKTKEEKNKSVIKKLREIRDNISCEIKDMKSDEIIEYLKKQKTLYPKENWEKPDKLIKQNRTKKY